MMRWTAVVVAAVVLAAAVPATAQQRVKVLADFEDPGGLRVWEFKRASATLVEDHATGGRRALRIAGNEYMVSFRLPRDWSGFDALEFDAFVEGDAPVAGSLLIADEAWQKSGGSYWNRHNGTFNLRPGRNTVSIPVNGLYRGEAGSRNNDLKTNIDPAKVIRLDLGFSGKGAIYVDQLRLVKEHRPEGIVALDLGPPSQAVAPGFTAITFNTVYGKDGAKAGLRFASSSGGARDDTFPTRLYQDFVSLDGNELIVAVPAGRYGVWVVYDDLGYWGGEAARHRRRSIRAEGKLAWSEDRGEEGPADYLYRFDGVEPRPGDSMWELYVRPLFEPKRFEAEVTDGALNLRFDADGPLACKVAAVIVHPAGDREAAAWVEEVERRNREEFESRAVFTGPRAKALEPPAEARTRGLWVGYPSLEDNVTFVDAPGPAHGKLERKAARGQRVSLTFAVRPLSDAAAGPVEVTASELAGPGGASIPASAVDVRYVQHAAHRSFNSIAYSIGPESLRPVAGSGLKLEKDLTRQFWITVAVPAGAKPGTYRGTLSIRGTGGAPVPQLELPLTIEVLDFALDEPDFAMGFYGTRVPREVAARLGEDEALRELLRTYREAGMTTISGGPSIRFSGLDAQGKPQLDFAAADRFFKLVKEAGFTQPLDGYGGLGMVSGLHDGYVVGETGRAWERKTGKPFGELLAIVWGAVREHAEANAWPRVRLGFTDEPRVLAQAQAQLELMKLYRKHVPWAEIGGSYSVRWNDDPLEKVIQEIFATLRWSALNAHSQTDLDKGRQLGADVLMYNQGLDRYSFGAYQWAQMHKGIKGRLQWHTLALHGYQFFHLDGREPDTAVVNWSRRDGLVPTVALHRCCEGADDLRYAVTLWNLAQKGKGTPVADEAIAFLEGVSRAIPVGRNRRPDGFMSDDAFRDECARRIAALVRP